MTLPAAQVFQTTSGPSGTLGPDVALMRAWAMTAERTLAQAFGLDGQPLDPTWVAGWAFQFQLVDDGVYDTVVNGLPIDPTDADFKATIAFRSGAPVGPGHALYVKAQALLGYTDLQMESLMDDARAQSLTGA